MSAGFSSLNEMEEHSESQDSPVSGQPSETDSNGMMEEGGASWMGVGPGMGGGDSLRRCGQRKRSDLMLLSCASLLASVALGHDLVQLGHMQDEQDQREEQRKKKEGLFRGRGVSAEALPPSRTLSLSLSHGKHHESTLPSLDPSPSVTLLSLSSLSDCNSTKSLLPSDPDDPVLTPAGPAPCPTPSPALNPLLDLRAESFKREPNQSLTPTHVSAAMALNRGHRRTPSDGAIRPRAQTLGHRRTPSDGSAPLPPAPTPGLAMPHTGCRDTLEIPRLPDPSTIFPTAHRRKVPPPPPLDDGPASGTLERPKTLEFAPRPRPTPARARADPWRLGSLSRTLSSSPGSSCDSPLGSGDGGGGGGGDRGGAAQPTLLDMDTEGQSQDSTVPLCGQHVPPPTLCGQHFS
ncbi:hypothetical protein AGOR_G00121530 [Albula goreensis]|uniref:Uncharacterized protein n=1 Tax=Albula goreensis TaxID=1534307 RepID=A0A8T3DCD2_9TELE|nr:hypothetical protein AGOR_G00121530 [Albula goreensis]